MARKKKRSKQVWTPRDDKKPPKEAYDEEMFSHERCPDCEYEGRLDTCGLPLPVGRVPLRKATHPTRRALATAGCQTCKGSGRIARPIPIDPMFQKKVS